MSFRANLQYLRAQRNMPQEQLAMLLGVSRQAISKWESEKAYPEMDKLLMICDLFGCTLDDLVLGDVSASVNVGAAARGAAEGDHGSAARTVTGEGAGEPAYMKDADGNIGESARSGGDGINGPSSANALPGEMLHGTSSSRPGTLANVAALPQDLTGYDEHRCRFALLIAGGVAAIIAGAGIGNLFDSDNSGYVKTEVETGLWLKRLVPDRGFNQRITKPSVQYSPSDSFKPFAVASITVCSAGR